MGGFFCALTYRSSFQDSLLFVGAAAAGVRVSVFAGLALGRTKGVCWLPKLVL